MFRSLTATIEETRIYKETKKTVARNPQSIMGNPYSVLKPPSKNKPKKVENWAFESEDEEMVDEETDKGKAAKPLSDDLNNKAENDARSSMQSQP